MSGEKWVGDGASYPSKRGQVHIHNNILREAISDLGPGGIQEGGREQVIVWKKMHHDEQQSQLNIKKHKG